jgi:hypothetical protein
MNKCYDKAYDAAVGRPEEKVAVAKAALTALSKQGTEIAQAAVKGELVKKRALT